MIDTEKIPLTEADTAAYDSTAQILKAAMAYVNPSIGRMMAVMAKSIVLRGKGNRAAGPLSEYDEYGKNV